MASQGERFESPHIGVQVSLPTSQLKYATRSNEARVLRPPDASSNDHYREYDTMTTLRLLMAFVLLNAIPLSRLAAEPVHTTAALISAVKLGAEGATIEVAEGTYELDEPLELKARMTLKGAGMDKTILTQTSNRKPSSKTLPDPEMKLEGLDTDAYLIRLRRDSAGITVSDLTLHAPQLHGAIFGWFNADMHLHHLRIKETQWSGIRTFGMKHASIHDCEFIDAGGRWEKGQPGTKGGITGGGIFAIWMADSDIANNRFLRTRMEREHEFYGIKVRQAKRCRVHHNTIEVNFSMEFPFENDEDNELDHNVCFGTISLPKYAGGPLPESGKTFHVHHNWFRDSYSIEFVRNGIEIDHNLFDFDPDKDHGNLISGFGQATANGPATFHNNLVSNPGRGVIWINEVFNHLVVRNNHIISRKTKTPRTDGLFGLNPKSDFATISIRDNIIECQDLPRPLLRSDESYRSTIENNRLTNISDIDQIPNPQADRIVGLETPLMFTCGVNGEFTIDGWDAKPPPQ
ncbi:MAG: right-handed parallel beta-helix repeat-containing protein [Planctomycetaceae bacterium]